MAGTIVFTVAVPDGAELLSPDLMNMGLYAIFKGTESYSVDGFTEFRFDQAGIGKISTQQLFWLIQFGAIGVQCRGQIGPRYIELTAAEYNGPVPVQFPESTKTTPVEPIDGEPQEPLVEQMTFAEYCPFGPVQSIDGAKVIINISERADGETCGDGTSWPEYLTWHAAFGDRLLAEGQRNALAGSEAYAQVEAPE